MTTYNSLAPLLSGENFHFAWLRSPFCKYYFPSDPFPDQKVFLQLSSSSLLLTNGLLDFFSSATIPSPVYSPPMMPTFSVFDGGTRPTDFFPPPWARGLRQAVLGLLLLQNLTFRFGFAFTWRSFPLNNSLSLGRGFVVTPNGLLNTFAVSSVLSGLSVMRSGFRSFASFNHSFPSFLLSLPSSFVEPSSPLFPGTSFGSRYFRSSSFDSRANCWVFAVPLIS